MLLKVRIGRVEGQHISVRVKDKAWELWLTRNIEALVAKKEVEYVSTDSWDRAKPLRSKINVRSTLKQEIHGTNRSSDSFYR